jgi:hypothetical protein
MLISALMCYLWCCETNGERAVNSWLELGNGG